MNLNKVVLRPSNTKKGMYGLKISEDDLIFFKDNMKYLTDSQDMFKKIDFTYSKALLIDKNKHTTYYAYDNDLYNNTLYDALYFNGKYWKKRRKWFEILNKSLTNNYRIISFSESESKKFFLDRIEKIKDSKKYSRNKKILDEVIDKMNKIEDYAFRAYISNGDLTDTNICLNGKICDTECFGLNIVIADMAIFFVSMIYGCWIYPKYNQGAYLFRKNKIINPHMKLNKRQLDIMKRILNIIAPIEYDMFKSLVIMRLVTPFGLDEMDDEDRRKVDDLISTIYISDYNKLISNISKHFKECAK